MSLLLLFHPRAGTFTPITHAEFAVTGYFSEWDGIQLPSLTANSFSSFIGKLIDHFDAIVGKPFDKD
jgi:hypothetical protein